MKPKPISKQQRDLWEELNETIRKNAGAVVSLPDVSPIRFECEQGSDLPWHLSRCGYEVRSMGTNERLMPFVEVLKDLHGQTVQRSHMKPQSVGVFEVDLPEPPSKSLGRWSRRSLKPAA